MPPFLAYDAPGCGETACADVSRVSIPLLVAAARAVLRELEIERFHLVGHSMGGLTALLLASREPSPVLSFIDVRGIFESMVELSHHGDLMTKFRSLPCPRMFMYGEQNSSLSYLPTLAANGIDLAEISDSSHWPMYSNPVAMWERIAEFLTRKKLP